MLAFGRTLIYAVEIENDNRVDHLMSVQRHAVPGCLPVVPEPVDRVFLKASFVTA